ncbi:MAG: hypothetical protein ACI85I_002070 [Arenicella sp.]|jgi:hypothetical protein
MSDIILKFWPKEESQNNYCETIKKNLIEKNIIENEETIWGRTAHKTSKNIRHYFKPEWEYAEEYFSNTHIVIVEKGYGVDLSGTEINYFDRKSVIELHNADGTISKWNDFIRLLSDITGIEHEGNWEIA